MDSIEKRAKELVELFFGKDGKRYDFVGIEAVKEALQTEHDAALERAAQTPGIGEVAAARILALKGESK